MNSRRPVARGGFAGRPLTSQLPRGARGSPLAAAPRRDGAAVRSLVQRLGVLAQPAPLRYREDLVWVRRVGRERERSRIGQGHDVEGDAVSEDGRPCGAEDDAQDVLE
jgi:hypothetical protein